jgi:hypothetical protein
LAADQLFRDQLVALIPSLRSFARGLCGWRDMADDMVQFCIELAKKHLEPIEKDWQAKGDEAVGAMKEALDAKYGPAWAVLAGKRVLYIFDSTSPILAGEHFRRSSLSVRSRALCDDWQGWAMAHEQRLESITYWWSHSHCGHLPEAAVDALAKEYLRGDPVPLPPAYCRHRSIRHYAKGSERELMLQVHNLHMCTRYTTPTALYADRRSFEFLRHAKLNDQQRSLVMALRDDRVRLLGSRAYDATGPHSLGAVLTEMGCPCGKGRQTVAHRRQRPPCTQSPGAAHRQAWRRG